MKILFLSLFIASLKRQKVQGFSREWLAPKSGASTRVCRDDENVHRFNVPPKTTSRPSYCQLLPSPNDNDAPEKQQNGESGNNSFASFWRDRCKLADTLEIRLDATLVACHVLARFLCYDTSLPAKTVPGFEVTDVIALLNTFSSASALCLFWTLAGLLVGLFEDVQNFKRIAGTALLATPPWIFLEQRLGWSYTVSLTGYATNYDVIEQVILGFAGLLATMTLSRLVPKMMR